MIKATEISTEVGKENLIEFIDAYFNDVKAEMIEAVRDGKFDKDKSLMITIEYKGLPVFNASCVEGLVELSGDDINLYD